MRRLSITFLLVFAIFSLGNLPVFSAVKGGIEYDIPIDYSNLSEDDLTEMLTFANAAAALITTKKGALRVMPEKEEIYKVLEMK